MNRARLLGLLVCTVVMSAQALLGAETSGREGSSPVLPGDSLWPGAMILAVIGLFLMAAVIGPVVRAQLPDALSELPPQDSSADNS